MIKPAAAVVAAAAMLALPAACAAQAEHVYFGGLHSHTSNSDGSGHPDEAFAHARDVVHCDFWAVTEHNHNVDMHPKEPRQGKPSIGADHTLYGPGNNPANGQEHPSLIAAANVATSSHFVALYGQVSGVYHTNPDCPGCKAIKPENRVTGEDAKNGRSPHNCPPQ